MHVVDPWKSYRQVATKTAPPGQLVLMLYDGALRSLERALAGFAHEDPAQFNMTVHNNLQRATDIIRELNLALNMEKGGQFAATLRRLYEYFDRRIWESNVQKKRDGIDEVIRHLTVLRDAWATMLSGLGNAAEPEAT
jgi:flagellar protein FliS